MSRKIGVDWCLVPKPEVENKVMRSCQASKTSRTSKACWGGCVVAKREMFIELPSLRQSQVAMMTHGSRDDWVA